MDTPAVNAAPGKRFSLMKRIEQAVDYAFQPIVNVHSGAVYGYEALLRGLDGLGLENVDQLLQLAVDEGLLGQLDYRLRELAIHKFARIPHAHRCHLFFNLDPRMLETGHHEADRTRRMLGAYGLPATTLVVELTELQDVTGQPAANAGLNRLRQCGHHLAIDDFGTGFSGLKLLYEHPPELIKIDRFFISNVAVDQKKKLFVQNTVELAHVLGILVIAEGVETVEEYHTCREIGCDLAQGYFVARPTTDLAALQRDYPHIGDIARGDRRGRDLDSQLVREMLEPIPSIRAGAGMTRLFETFRDHQHHHFFPVVDDNDEPLGVVHESDLKQYTYSHYGRELITNPVYRKGIHDFTRPCPRADVHTPVEDMLAIYTANENKAGIVIVDDLRYLGVLSTTSLLRIINEKNLALARDQNPLTRLPGNNAIVRYVSQALEHTADSWTLVYFDFDNFKPFNDHYGFRQGDRAIALFAELLSKHLLGEHSFVGHIGGDDFFAGFCNTAEGEVERRVAALQQRFAADVQSFYEPEARARGGIVASDRDGRLREYPLLTVSAVILTLPRGSFCTADALSRQMADLKKLAKGAPDHRHVSSLGSSDGVADKTPGVQAAAMAHRLIDNGPPGPISDGV